jgi:hypothetical protein
VAAETHDKQLSVDSVTCGGGGGVVGMRRSEFSFFVIFSRPGCRWGGSSHFRVRRVIGFRRRRSAVFILKNACKALKLQGGFSYVFEEKPWNFIKLAGSLTPLV